MLYLDVHDYDNAYDALSRALDTLSKAEVRLDDAAASVMANIGGIMLKRGQFAAGKRLYDEAIES